MARTGKKDRPLACVYVSFQLSPSWDKAAKKFTTPIPEMRVINKEVIDEDDTEFGGHTTERINLQAQIEQGLLTPEEVAPVFDLIRKAWDNVALMQEPTI